MKGAHARSGAMKDPNSIRSAKAGIQLTALPAEGYDGDAPNFPLPDETYNETSLWLWAWKQPQAVAWARDPWRWPTIALWVRTFVKCSSEDAKAVEVNSLHRLADEIGMTIPGMKMNGWTIARDEVAEKREDRTAVAPARSARDRLRDVSGS